MPRWSDKQLNDIFDETDGICYLCGKKLAWKNYGDPGERGAWEVEHMRPLSRGGSNSVKRNLLPACIPCNRKKGTMTVNKWFGLK